jgi:hypothetical protein
MPWFNTAEVAAPPALPEAQPPEAVVRIGAQVKAVMPIIEDITGLSRRDITLALLKGTAKGGSVEGVINFLTGQQKTPPRDKFMDRIKALAIWGPVAFFGFGLAIFFLFFMMKIMVHMAGGLT